MKETPRSGSAWRGAAMAVAIIPMLSNGSAVSGGIGEAALIGKKLGIDRLLPRIEIDHRFGDMPAITNRLDPAGLAIVRRFGL